MGIEHIEIVVGGIDVFCIFPFYSSGTSCVVNSAEFTWATMSSMSEPLASIKVAIVGLGGVVLLLKGGDEVVLASCVDNV